MSILETKDLSKQFKTINGLLDLFKAKPSGQVYKVLENISFSLNPGESLGIIGKNGAGKSTLAKIIANTLTPSQGEINVNGTVHALLELGLGAHPEFTVRENVYLIGLSIGLSSQFVDEHYDEIIDFAELRDHQDKIFKELSTGMQMRLSFSVATIKRPDFLIVDEALSVGDISFQFKSFEKIKEFKKLGTTLVIISHDETAIKTLCDKALLLDLGKIIYFGSPNMAFENYNKYILPKKNRRILNDSNNQINHNKSGTLAAQTDKFLMVDSTNEPISIIETGSEVKLIFDIKVNTSIEKLVCGFSIRSTKGLFLFGTNSALQEQYIINPEVGKIYRYEFDLKLSLAPGDYLIQSALHPDITHLNECFEWNSSLSTFKIINTQKFWFEGMMNLDNTLKIIKPK
jgi:lipopolysaccharide transport system ATP-binding protein